MTQKAKLEKICADFCSLNEEKQEYILGMLQALAFAKDEMGTDQPVEVDKNNIEGASL